MKDRTIKELITEIENGIEFLDTLPICPTKSDIENDKKMKERWMSTICQMKKKQLGVLLDIMRFI